MADEPELAALVRSALAAVADVEEKRMFGRTAFMVDGSLRLAVGAHEGHVLLVRAGDAADAETARPGVAPAVMRGRPMRGWLAVDREAAASEEDVRHWVDVSLAAVRA